MRGQYRGYANEEGVQAGSDVETYVALRFEIDSWRWAGVPWLIRTGKSLSTTATEAVVRFNDPPRLLFAEDGSRRAAPNELRFRMGRNDGVTLHLQAKEPGDQLVTQPIDLDVSYDAPWACGRRPTSACSKTRWRVTAAASAGPTASTSSGASCGAVLDDPPETLLYKEGSMGPSAADALAEDVGGWRDPLPPDQD